MEEEGERKVLVLIKEGGANLSQTLDNPSPLKLDKKKVGYVTGGSNNRKTSSSKTQVPKKKGCSWGRNPKNVDVKAMREWEASEEFIDHEQEDHLKDEDVFALINAFVVNTSIASSFGPNMATLDEDDSKNTSEEL